MPENKIFLMIFPENYLCGYLFRLTVHEADHSIFLFSGRNAH
ncbi:MAG: hypothetical protein JWM28_3792, partial [Chitinophagaceae bacterium]|nr:hypothetical protein [Chitinophagaceae bacterium]